MLRKCQQNVYVKSYGWTFFSQKTSFTYLEKIFGSRNFAYFCRNLKKQGFLLEALHSVESILSHHYTENHQFLTFVSWNYLINFGKKSVRSNSNRKNSSQCLMFQVADLLGKSPTKKSSGGTPLINQPPKPLTLWFKPVSI